MSEYEWGARYVCVFFWFEKKRLPSNRRIQLKRRDRAMGPCDNIDLNRQPALASFPSLIFFLKEPGRSSFCFSIHFVDTSYDSARRLRR